MSKCAYFMTVIDGVFCLRCASYKQTQDVSTITLDWSEMKNRRTK